jgi:hypothetical protein
VVTKAGLTVHVLDGHFSLYIFFFFISAHGKPVLVFPWVVMQELDYLKTGKTASASMVSLTNDKRVSMVTCDNHLSTIIFVLVTQ